MRRFKTQASALAALPVLALLLTPALAAQPEKYEIRAAAQSEDFARITEPGGKVDAVIQIKAKVIGRFTGTTPACEAAINFGDNSPTQKVILGEKGGTSNITDISHAYDKPGRYPITVTGLRSTRSCDGRASAEVIILGPKDQADSYASRNDDETRSSRRKSRRSKNTLNGGGLFDFDNLSVESGRNPCPPGWEIVSGSNNAQYRFTCRAAPVKPIVCQGGTSYFDNGNTIGCK